MENFTPGQIVVIAIGLLLAAAGAVNTLGSAAEKIVKAWRAAKAPSDVRDQRIGAMEGEMDSFRSYFSQDKQRLDSLEEGNRVTQRALLALLSHGIDGNHVEAMVKARDDLQDHLINQ